MMNHRIDIDLIEMESENNARIIGLFKECKMIAINIQIASAEASRRLVVLTEICERYSTAIHSYSSDMVSRELRATGAQPTKTDKRKKLLHTSRPILPQSSKRNIQNGLKIGQLLHDLTEHDVEFNISSKAPGNVLKCLKKELDKYQHLHHSFSQCSIDKSARTSFLDIANPSPAQTQADEFRNWLEKGLEMCNNSSTDITCKTLPGDNDDISYSNSSFPNAYSAVFKKGLKWLVLSIKEVQTWHLKSEQRDDALEMYSNIFLFFSNWFVWNLGLHVLANIKMLQRISSDIDNTLGIPFFCPISTEEQGSYGFPTILQKYHLSMRSFLLQYSEDSLDLRPNIIIENAIMIHRCIQCCCPVPQKYFTPNECSKNRACVEIFPEKHARQLKEQLLGAIELEIAQILLPVVYENLKLQCKSPFSCQDNWEPLLVMFKGVHLLSVSNAYPCLSFSKKTRIIH